MCHWNCKLWATGFEQIKSNVYKLSRACLRRCCRRRNSMQPTFSVLTCIDCVDSTRYGYITSTPKAGWQNTDFLGAFQRAFPDVPCAIDTDVNGAALAELRLGNYEYE
jgi:hypothetical protein